MRFLVHLAILPCAFACFAFPQTGNKDGAEELRSALDDLIDERIEAHYREEDEKVAMESNKQVDEEYCLTPGCVKAAAVVLNMYDNTVDPCEDFYKFSCGTFLKESVIPDHKKAVGVGSLMKDVLNERLRKLFEGKGQAGEPKVFGDVRNYYNSCMNQSLIKNSGKREVLQIVEKLGGWPLLQGQKWSGEKFFWQNQAEMAKRLGINIFGKLLQISIGVNNNNSAERMLEISQASLGLSREYLVKGLDDKVVQAYLKYMVDVAVYFGAEPETAEKELKDSFEFEQKLAKITLPKEELRNKTAINNPMTISEFSKLYPGYDWVHYMNNRLDNKDIIVDENEVVNVEVPKYVEALTDLLSTVDNRVVANYMMWRYIESMVSYLDKDALAIRFIYNKVLHGQSQESPRWEICVMAVAGIGRSSLYFYEGSLTNAVGSMYAHKYFPEEKKDLADKMVINIKQEFRIMLDELEWMDAATKANAHYKVDSMKPHIAYSREILDTDLMNEFYNGLSLNSESFLTNSLKLKRFILAHYSKEFRQPIDKNSWKNHGGAAIMDAFYSSSENSINFPAGILDGILFKVDRPAYMNYGAIGMVIGHEITHGFDDQGAQWDGDGNLFNWWAKETQKNNLEKAQCIIGQYGNYSVQVNDESINLNGIHTQGENIADNGGYKEAFRAYKRLVAKHGPEPRLPGLPYTQRQMFWLAGAQINCGTMRPEHKKYIVLTDPHSPAQYRVNGPFSNLPEFAADWNCPVGSPMNPAKKCTVW